MRVDYDRVAARYDDRYAWARYEGVEQALTSFLRTSPRPAPAVLEVGCGTGRWVQGLHAARIRPIGVDISRGMLSIARARVVGARLVRARAEALPLLAGSIDRVFCVNALHHFVDAPAFFGAAWRVLRHGGGLMTVGLDPHTGRDRWWIYDYFPEALVEDLQRYPAAPAIREAMRAAGFSRCETREVQQFAATLSPDEVVERGLLERTTTSQLMVISDAAYAAGMRRMASQRQAAAGDRTLRVDLRLYATTGWVD
jgi:SAM-dependent methyltransferase